MSEWTDYQAQIAALNNGDNGIGRITDPYQAAAAQNAYFGESAPAAGWQPPDPSISTGDGSASINSPWLDYYNPVSLPGQEGKYTWDPTHNQYYQPEGGKWNMDGMNNVSVVHDNGTGHQDGQGVAHDTIQIDKTPTFWDKFIDVAMPAAVAIITGGAGAAAIGGAMGAAGAAGAAGGAAEGTAAGAAGTAAESAPIWSYGSQAPSWAGWSQAGGTELGSGLFGTDAASMAGTFGTTAGAGSGAGLGAELGTGLAADGGIWAGAGGGMPGLMAEASGGSGLMSTAKDAYDLYKKANNAYKLYNAVTGQPTAAVGQSEGATAGLNGGSGMVGSGGLSQALAASSGVKVGVPGMAQHTDMTSEIGQIPLANLLQTEMPKSNNALPKSQDSAMLGGLGLGKFPYL
jgi:hypothetical protein